jgi:DNA-binding response OmpR family regulator
LDNRQATVLIVDDNPVASRAMATLLRGQGYEPVVFPQAAPAHQYAETNRVDAALVDIHLPDSSGLELSQKLRTILGEAVPIIIVSGDTSMQTLRALPHVGATLFMAKPVNVNVLLERLKEGVSAVQS